MNPIFADRPVVEDKVDIEIHIDGSSSTVQMTGNSISLLSAFAVGLNRLCEAGMPAHVIKNAVDLALMLRGD